MIDDSDLDEMVSAAEDMVALAALGELTRLATTALGQRMIDAPSTVITAASRHRAEHGHDLRFGCCALSDETTRRSLRARRSGTC